MSPRDDDHEQAAQSGLDTLVDLRSKAVSDTNSGLSAMPSIVFDPNRFRLERMLQREHLVYGVPTPFVGREQAQEQLMEALAQTERSGRLHVATLTGDAGLGKTRLLAEVFAATNAIERGVEVMGACCSESEAPDGIAVVAQLLGRRFQVAPNMSAATTRERLLEAIEPLVDTGYVEVAASQLGYLMGLDIPQLVDGAPRPEDGERYLQVALSTCFNLMSFHARLAPQVMVFHRAQFMTRGAHAFLTGLTTALAETPTLILLLADAPIADFRGAEDTPGIQIAFTPFKHAEMEQLVHGILQRLADPPATLIQHIVRRSAGNPRLAEDNIRLLVQKGILRVEDEAWTLSEGAFGDELDLASTHQAASMARVEGLEPDVRHVLTLASVCGPTFWFEGVLSLLRAHPGGAPEMDAPWISDPMADWLEGVLSTAMSGGLVGLQSTSALEGQQELTFTGTHDHGTLYEAIPPDEKAGHHRLVAQWLAGLPLDHPAPWYGVIAEHWESGGRPIEAAEWFEKAARGARGVYDLRRAKALYQRALTLVDVDQIAVLLPVLEGFAETCFTGAEFKEAKRAYGALLEASLISCDQGAGGRAWLMLGRAHRCLGEYGRAGTCFGHAVTVFGQAQDIAGLADGREQQAILLRLEGADGACVAALALHEQSLESRQREGDVRGVAKSLEHIASTHLQMGRLGEAESGLEQALDLRRQLGDLAGQAGPLGNVGMVRHAQGDIEGAIEAWRSGLSIAEQMGDRELVGIFLNNIGESYFELGEHALARTALADARQISMETGDQRTLADVLRNLGALALAKGEWERGLAAVDEAIRLSTQMGSRVGLGQALRTRGSILGHQLYADDSLPERVPGEAADCFKDASAIFEDMGDQIELEKTLHAYGRFLADRGSLPEAEVILARARKLRKARESVA